MTDLVNSFRKRFIKSGKRVRVKKWNRFCQYIGNNEILTETFFGKKIFLDSRDISLTPNIIYDGHWEKHIARFLEVTLKPGQTFLDVGANCGFFSLLAGHRVRKEGLVLAIEPQERLASLLRRSFAVNGYQNHCSVIKCAAGDAPRKTEIAREQYFTGGASLAGLHEERADWIMEGEAVDIRTLDEILASESERLGKRVVPDVMKMDIEGYEIKALRGMRSLLQGNDRLTIVMEFVPQRYFNIDDDPREFLSEMAGYGFEIGILTRNRPLEKADDKEMGNILKSNKHVELVFYR